MCMSNNPAPEDTPRGPPGTSLEGGTGKPTGDPVPVVPDTPQPVDDDKDDPTDPGGDDKGDTGGGGTTIPTMKPSATAAQAGSGASRMGRDNARRRKEGKPPTTRRDTGLKM